MMVPYSRIACLVCLLCMGGMPSPAQETLTLRQALDRALGQNPQAAMARADDTAASAGASLARTGLLPRLTFTAPLSGETMATRKEAARAGGARRVHDERLKDEVYRHMLRLEAGRAGAELDLAVALLRGWLADYGRCTEELREWLMKGCPIGLLMLEAERRGRGAGLSCMEQACDAQRWRLAGEYTGGVGESPGRCALN